MTAFELFSALAGVAVGVLLAVLFVPVSLRCWPRPSSSYPPPFRFRGAKNGPAPNGPRPIPTAPPPALRR